jgi:hypothetical protein
VSLPETKEHVEALWDVLHLVRKGRRWVAALALVDAVDEVRRWTEDDRQWHHANSASWQSALRDLRDSLTAHEDDVLGQIKDYDAVRDELDRLVAAAGDKAIRTERALRHRTARVLEAVESGLTTPRAIQAAWLQLRHRVDHPRYGPEAAERLLALARWAGHDPARICETLENCLYDRRRNAVQEAPAERLRRAVAVLDAEPAHGDVVVWLRARYAPVHEPPTIEIGQWIHIYDATWLRAAFADPDRGHELPPEAADGTRDRLRSLARRQLRTGAADPPEDDVYPTEGDIAVACIRIDLRDVVVDRAVDIARRAAGAITCLGTLDGGSPNMWQLEETFLTFRDGRRGRSTATGPPDIAVSAIDHMRAEQDPTHAVIRRHAPQLALVLPDLVEPQRSAIDLLRWLRSAKTAPPAARLILCDRAVESVSGWAGIASPRRFIDEHLIPSWAYGRIRSSLFAIAIDVMFNDDRRHYFEDKPERIAWQEIIDHPDIEFDRAAWSVNLAGLLRQWDWLVPRLPIGDRAWRRAHEIGADATDGKRMGAWFGRLVADGRRLEGRRTRTRNALMHGGPASDEIIEAVLPFAEHLANEAVARSFLGSIEGRDPLETFAQHDALIRRAVSDLKAAVPPERALFSP